MTVVMPTRAPIMKVTACRECEANVILYGDHIGDVYFLHEATIVVALQLMSCFAPFVVQRLCNQVG